jgi:glutamate-5-semialdehyde dehydrogenase
MIYTTLEELAAAAKTATFKMAMASSTQKNAALEVLVENLKKHREIILQANRQDKALAQADGLSTALLERLSLENQLEGIIHDIAQVIQLPDPVGELFDEQNLPNQLKLAKRRIPIGVLGVIYESRPNVTLDISTLTIKSGNCAILRGGSETLHTNRILVEIIQKSLDSVDLPREAIQLIATPDRAEVKKILHLHNYIDLIIPRGSSTLQQFCREHSKIPVIIGGIGICHLFVDETADLDRSLMVILNAKIQRPTVCNALDTLLVHTAIAPLFIPQIVKILGEQDVVFRLDPKAWSIAPEPTCKLATLSDWDTEWMSLVLGIKVVENLKEAIGHVQMHGGHSDGILTENHQNAELFIREVDSAAIYVNASTRFTDGGQFGLGAEVAISTQKLHARGPMGLKELTSYKWIVRGDYQIRTPNK